MEEETKTCDNCEACAGGCTMHEGAEAPMAEESEEKFKQENPTIEEFHVYSIIIVLQV